MLKTDVCVIGGGIVGTNVLRVLSKYHIHSVLLEANMDIGSGVTKGNGGVVHSGYDAHHGTLKAMLNVKGAKMYPKLAKELDFVYDNTPTLTVGFDQDDRDELEKLLKNGYMNGVEGLRIVEQDELQIIEPQINKKALCALYATSAGFVDPYEVAQACAENAVLNGAEVFTNARVVEIQNHHEGFIIKTKRMTVHAKAIINCAGVYGDVIAKMVDDPSYEIQQRHGTLLIIDQAIGFRLRTSSYPVPRNNTKGMAVIAASAGNIIIGSTATMTHNKENHEFTKEEVEHLIDSAKTLVPALSKDHIIRIFTGLRPVEMHRNNDFVVEESKIIPCFFNCIGIQSPGIAAAPAVADYVVSLLASRIPLNLRKDYDPTRESIIDFSKCDEKKQRDLIQLNADYGHVVCRCELVTEAEIKDAIHRPCGATTIDGIKRRTRAGMGRCQGGFCQPRVLEILHKELEVDPYDILLEEEGSLILKKLKETNNV